MVPAYVQVVHTIFSYELNKMRGPEFFIVHSLYPGDLSIKRLREISSHPGIFKYLRIHCPETPTGHRLIRH